MSKITNDNCPNCGSWVNEESVCESCDMIFEETGINNITKLIKEDMLNITDDQANTLDIILNKVFQLGVSEGMVREGCSSCGEKSLDEIVKDWTLTNIYIY